MELIKERDEGLIALGGQQTKLMKKVTISSIIKSQGMVVIQKCLI